MPTTATTDFRRHLSRYLDRVRRGERIIVTDRGEPVAEVIPYQAERPADAVTAQMVALAAQGLITLPSRPLAELSPPAKLRTGTPAATVISNDREHGR